MDDGYRFKNKVCPICDKEIGMRYKIYKGYKICSEHKLKEIFEYGASHKN